MIQDEPTQTMVDLGLSLLQAKTYLSLAKLGKADVKTIANASNVARQDIYRIMPTLEKLGLAEKIISKTTMYKATPIKEGLLILLRNRKEEYAELQKKTSSLLNNFHQTNAKIALQEENSQFIVTSEIKRLLKMHERLTQTAQTSIDVAIPSKIVTHMLFNNLQYFKNAMRRGAKIRVIAQKAEGEPAPRKPQALAKNLFFELKCLSNPDPLGMVIFDRKEVTLCISEKGAVPSLWSNNSCITKLAVRYFDEMWNKGTIEPQPIPRLKRKLYAQMFNQQQLTKSSIRVD